jgi:hypothetical protein
MPEIDKDTLVKIVAAVAAIIAAFIAGMLGFYTQWRIKRFDKSLAEKKDKERERLRFYIPLLRSLYELDDRFDRIIMNLETDWLNAEYLDKIKNKQGFADNPNNKGYFIISSIYLIASFFGLTEAIKKGVDTTRFSSEKRRIIKLWNSIRTRIYSTFGVTPKLNIFQFDPDITKVCRLFQYEELFRQYMASSDLQNPKDACKLHKHIQHSIGEMMLEKEGENVYRVKSFREFYESYVSDERFRFWFVLIENLFTDLSNFAKEKSLEKKAELKNDIRPLRIIAIQYWCRVLMRNISVQLDLAELNLQTRPPDAVFNGLSDKLKDTIRSYTLENMETYLLGLNYNKI